MREDDLGYWYLHFHGSEFPTSYRSKSAIDVDGYHKRKDYSNIISFKGESIT